MPVCTFDDAVALLAAVANTKPLEVSDGAFGPLMSIELVARRELCANVVDGGVLMVNLTQPGGALFFGPDMHGDHELTQWAERYLAWQAGESDAELVELGAIDDPQPRIDPPAGRIVRGTVMTVTEAQLSTFPQDDDSLDLLAAPYQETNTPLPELSEVWLLMVGLVDPPAE